MSIKNIKLFSIFSLIFCLIGTGVESSPLTELGNLLGVASAVAPVAEPVSKTIPATKSLDKPAKDLSSVLSLTGIFLKINSNLLIKNF